MKPIKLLSIALLAYFLSIQVFAQEMISSENPQSTAHQLFGKSISLSGDWALVGAPQKDVDGKQSVGSVFLYRKYFKDGWKIEQEISPADLPEYSSFGSSVDIVNWNVAAISSMGSPEGGLLSEVVYIYEYDGDSKEWFHSQTLKPSDARPGMRFGNSLSFGGSPYEADILAVGAYNADGNETKSGAVYIFERTDSGWVETQKLVADDGVSNDFFGHSLTMAQLQDYSTTRLVIGAYNATGAEERSGAVYIFEKEENGTFVQSGKIFDAQGSSSDLFGYSTELTQPLYIITKSNSARECGYEDLVFIGAPGSNNENGQTGSVYIACKNGEEWAINKEFSDPESEHNEHFGISFGLDQYNGLIFIGANRTNSKEGKIYTYSLFDNNFTSPEYVNPPALPELTVNEYFGSNIATSGLGDMIISSPYKNIESNINSGAVYFYNYPVTPNEEEPLGEITEYKLEQNYPNPFNPTTTLKYQVKEAGNVKLTVFNVLGQVVQVLIDEQKIIGAYSATFDASALSSGFYFYRLEVNDFSSTKKMMLIK